MKTNKKYTIKIVSTKKPYDEKHLFKSIFESLYSIKNLSPKSCADEIRKEKIVIA